MNAQGMLDLDTVPVMLCRQCDPAEIAALDTPSDWTLPPMADQCTAWMMHTTHTGDCHGNAGTCNREQGHDGLHMWMRRVGPPVVAWSEMRAEYRR